MNLSQLIRRLSCVVLELRHYGDATKEAAALLERALELLEELRG